jgi:hypothetical protein
MSPAHDLMERLAAADPVPDVKPLGPEQQREADALLEQLLATPGEPRPKARRRWPQLAAATALAAVAVFAALSLLDSDKGPARNVLAQAVAALTQEDAIYHAELIARAHSSDMPAANQEIFFESWHTTGGSTHTKTYAVKDGGKGRQYDDFAGRRAPGRLSGPALRYDPASNTILHSGFGRSPGVQGAPKVDPFAPGTGLKELRAQGRLRVSGRVDVDGKSAYRLVSDEVPGPGGSVERSEVLVNPDTYLPLEQRLFVRNRNGTTMSIVWRYLTYERLPLNDETRSLLALDPPPGAKCAPGAGDPPRRGSLGFPNPCRGR